MQIHVIDMSNESVCKHFLLCLSIGPPRNTIAGLAISASWNPLLAEKRPAQAGSRVSALREQPQVQGLRCAARGGGREGQARDRLGHLRCATWTGSCRGTRAGHHRIVAISSACSRS